MQLEQEGHAMDVQRKKEHEEHLESKRRRMGLPAGGGKKLTREEQEARIWNFMCVLSSWNSSFAP